MSVETFLESIPAYAKDLKLNLSAVLAPNRTHAAAIMGNRSSLRHCFSKSCRI